MSFSYRSAEGAADDGATPNTGAAALAEGKGVAGPMAKAASRARSSRRVIWETMAIASATPTTPRSEPTPSTVAPVFSCERPVSSEVRFA